MDAFSHAQLTDALARGRLAPAEIAAIPPRELEALFETAARCLDAGRDTEAVHLLGGLVTLFPFSARYWRGYAIALHRRLQVERARAAYEASLALEPAHELTRCYRCEILIYLERTDEAREQLRELLGASNRVAAERAAELLRQIDALAGWQPPPPDGDPELTHPAADQPRFAFDDQRDLPLEPSRFDDPVEPTVVRAEVTRTARIFAPISDEPTAPMMVPEVTDTALMRRRNLTAPGLPTENSITGTALLPGRKGRPPAAAPHPVEGSATALLPGRRGRPPAPEAELAENRDVVPVPWDDDASDTEVRGARPAPLRPGGPIAAPMGLAPDGSEEPTQTDIAAAEEPTQTDAIDEPTLTAVTLRRGGRLTFDGEDS